MEPLISVIVPIYGIDKYLGICIESIIKQTYSNLEIILVDDGSPDRCPELCDLYASKDQRIKVIHKSNGGLVSARKAGIMASTGQYIGYVDGDDWIGPGFYQSLYSAISEYDADVAIAGFSRDLFSKSQPMLNSISQGFYRDEKLRTMFSSMICNGDFFKHGITTYLWNKLFRREILLNHQMIVDDRITIGEDAAVVYPLLLDCKKICITDNCAYHYRQREDSMLKTSGDIKKELQKLRLLYNHLSKSVDIHKSVPNLRDQINEFMLGTYIIRSGGKLESTDESLSNFPIGIDLAEKRVLLYGAGTFGQQFKKRLEKEDICHIVGWVDDDYWEYRRCCMDVDSVERVVNDDYDYILILNIDQQYTEEKKRELLDFGVSREKIITLTTTKEIREKALSEYLKNSV